MNPEKFISKLKSMGCKVIQNRNSIIVRYKKDLVDFIPVDTDIGGLGNELKFIKDYIDLKDNDQEI